MAQLLELAPHVTRLVPVADRYLQSKSESREDSRRAMEQMADGLRGDLGQVADGMRGDLRQIAAAQAGIYHQLNEQGEMLAKIAADVRASKLANDEIEMRVARVDTQMKRLWIAFFAGVVLLTLATVGGVAVFAVVHIRQFVHGS
ncbi:MAG: hypothetical protein WB439_12425 [Acidobacteriaceae bacterium]